MKIQTDIPVNDPFFFDQDRLQTITDRTVIHCGLEDHRENRVMEIDQDQELLWGQVEGADPETPNEVEIRFDEAGLSFKCDCEDSASGSVCRHIVAVLLKYNDLRGETDQLLTATDSAIKDRIKRGRSEVETKRLSGEPWFGSWRATPTRNTYFRWYRANRISLIMSLPRMVNSTWSVSRKK